MSKPTFFQTVFNKPSRKYAQSNDYHRPSTYSLPPEPYPIVVNSEKISDTRPVHRRLSLHLPLDEGLDIFTTQLPYERRDSQSDSLTPPLPRASAAASNSTPDLASRKESNNRGAFHTTGRTSQPSSARPSQESLRSPSVSAAVGTSHTESMMSAATPTVRQSDKRSDTTTTRIPQQHVSRGAVSPMGAISGNSAGDSVTLASHHAATEKCQVKEVDNEDDEEDDVFYTPKTSPESSPFSSPPTASTSHLSAPMLTVTATTDTTAATVTGAVSKLTSLNPPPNHRHRVSWSDEVNAIASPASTSTASLSENVSDYGLNNSSYAPSESTAPTSVSHGPKTSSLDPPRRRESSSSQKRRSVGSVTGMSVTSAGTASSSKSKSKSLDLDWAKDVRWLVQPDEFGKLPNRSWTHTPATTHRVGTPASSTSSLASVDSAPVPRRSVDSPGDYLRDAYVPQRPAKHIRQPKALSISGISTASSSRRQQQPKHRAPQEAATVSGPIDPRLLRMSAVLEVDEDGNEIIIGSARPEVLHRHVSTIAATETRLSRRSSTRLRTISDPTSEVTAEAARVPPRRAESVRSASTSTSAQTTTSYKTVGLATTLQVSAGAEPGTMNGYTSLILPRAAYTPGKNPISSQVDLTRSGLAQTTMSTISIIKHAADPSNLPRRRFSGFFTSKNSSSASGKGKDRALEHALALTSNTPPPTKLPSGSVMVQVWAAGIDDLDRMLVKERSAKPEGYGFVPGRSFVGKVVEAGWEVINIGKGDWVVGLLEMNSRSGALAEFVVVDRKRVCRVPEPTSPSSKLSLEQMALLPLVGLPASRAARSVPRIMGRSDDDDQDDENNTPRPSMKRSMSSFADQPKEKKRVLVLGAQSPVGSMVVMYLKAMGLIVSAHVLAGTEVGVEVENVVEDDDVERALGRMQDSMFRMVVDTVGGKEVWKAAKRVLDPKGGQFTTTVGDTPTTLPTRQAHVKANMRSLRHAFRSKDDRAVGYAWICPAVDVDHDGEDVRDTLKVVADLALRGVCVPLVEGAVPFERTPSEAFSGEVQGRAVVVKVVS